MSEYVNRSSSESHCRECGSGYVQGYCPKCELGEEDEDDLLEVEWECPQCREVWHDEWDSACDDDCPKCGMRHIMAKRYRPAGSSDKWTDA